MMVSIRCASNLGGVLGHTSVSLGLPVVNAPKIYRGYSFYAGASHATEYTCCFNCELISNARGEFFGIGWASKGFT